MKKWVTLFVIGFLLGYSFLMKKISALEKENKNLDKEIISLESTQRKKIDEYNSKMDLESIQKEMIDKKKMEISEIKYVNISK